MALPESPERQLLAEQRIPHELMHIFLFNSTPLGYKNIPVWLTEGLASLAELYSNPDYPIVLEEAVKDEGLLPMSTLCGGFPRNHPERCLLTPSRRILLNICRTHSAVLGSWR